MNINKSEQKDQYYYELDISDSNLIIIITDNLYNSWKLSISQDKIEDYTNGTCDTLESLKDFITIGMEQTDPKLKIIVNKQEHLILQCQLEERFKTRKFSLTIIKIEINIYVLILKIIEKILKKSNNFLYYYKTRNSKG